MARTKSRAVKRPSFAGTIRAVGAGFLVAAAVLVSNSAAAQTSEDAVANELAIVLGNPCLRLLGGPPPVGRDPNEVLVGSLREICTRAPGALPRQTAAGGFAQGTPATAPGIIQRRLRETREKEGGKKVAGASADAVAELPSRLSLFISGEFESLSPRIALMGPQPDPWKLPRPQGVMAASFDPTAREPAPSEIAMGPIRVTGVEIQQATRNSAIIRIRADQPVASYKTFLLSGPPRLVIDIQGALMAESMSRKAAGKGAIKRIRASQYLLEPRPVVRVVLDLTSTLPYQVAGMPETFRILIGEAVAKAGKVQAAQPPPEIAKGPIRVTGVEIQEATPSSAIIRIRADQPVARYKTFVLSNPPRLVVDIRGALMAESMSRKAAGQGPIKRIRASQYLLEPKPVVRVVLDLTSTLPYQVAGMPETFRILIGEAVAKAGKAPPPEPPTVTAERPKFTPGEVAQAPEPGEPFWRKLNMSGSGEFESLDRDVTTFEDGYDSSIWRVTVGADYQFTDRIVAGLAFDAYWQDGTFDGGGDFENNSYGFLAYGSFLPTEQVYVQVVVGYARQSYERTRFASLTDTEAGADILLVEGPVAGEYNGNAYRAGVAAGYSHGIDNFTITPYAGLDWVRLEYDSYNETGSATGGGLIADGFIQLGDPTGLELRFDEDRVTSLQTRIGAQASVALRTGFGVIVPQASFDWRYEFENDQRDVEVSFVGDTQEAKRFTYETQPPDRIWFEINAGVVAVLGNQVQVFGNYRTIVGHSFFDSHAGTIGLRYTF